MPLWNSLKQLPIVLKIKMQTLNLPSNPCDLTSACFSALCPYSFGSSPASDWSSSRHCPFPHLVLPGLPLLSVWTVNIYFSLGCQLKISHPWEVIPWSSQMTLGSHHVLILPCASSSYLSLSTMISDYLASLFSQLDCVLFESSIDGCFAHC